MGQPTIFVDTTSKALREVEVPDADFDNGMNNGGSCAPGIGINMGEGAVVGTPEQFTLLDQDAAIRVPQDGQPIGGEAYTDQANDYPSSGGLEGKGILPILTGVNPTNAAKEAADPSIDGDLTVNGDANLQTIEAGWVATAV